MYEQQQAAEQNGPLAGFTVGVTAARRADELGALLQRRGAAVLHAPALRIVPLADDGELLAATKALLGQAPDIVVATTAIGFRGWVEAADGWGLGEELLERLRGVELLARGPKVKGAIRAAGLTEEWSPSSLTRLLAASLLISRFNTMAVIAPAEMPESKMIWNQTGNSA